MSKAKICICCSEETDKTILLHKTRRQTHQLCYDCAVGYLSPIIKTMTNNIRRHIKTNCTIKCPGTYHGNMRNKCCKIIPITSSNLLVNEDFPLYIDILRIKALINIPNTVLCINEDCGNVVEMVGIFNKITCTQCNTIWCNNCLAEPYHDGLSCLEHEIQTQDNDHIKYLRELNNQGTLKFCPSCHVATTKEKNQTGADVGCNKITCTTCGIKWCWLCQKANIDYDHFNSNGKDPCSNKLWLGTE